VRRDADMITPTSPKVATLADHLCEPASGVCRPGHERQAEHHVGEQHAADGAGDLRNAKLRSSPPRQGGERSR
jgi:hypothetical protein